METKQDLEKQRLELHEKISAIECEERRVANSALIGKHFKYRNSYGGDTAWWLYVAVTDVDEHGYLSTLKFQNDGDGRLSCETKVHYSSMSSYTEIPFMEFDLARKAFLKDVESLLGGNQ